MVFKDAKYTRAAFRNLPDWASFVFASATTATVMVKDSHNTYRDGNGQSVIVPDVSVITLRIKQMGNGTEIAAPPPTPPSGGANIEGAGDPGSATPGFIGQVYKDTTNGNIWRANSLTPGDWTLELQNYQVKWNPDTLNLGEAMGFFCYADLPGYTKIVFEGTTSIAGFDIDLEDLQELHFPNLVSIDPLNTQNGYFAFSGCTALTYIDISALTTVAWNFSCYLNPALTSLNATALTSVGFNFNCYSNASLASVDVSALTTVVGSFYVLTNPALTALNITALTSVGQNLGVTDSPALTSIDITAITSILGNVSFSGCALTAASVNAILAKLVLCNAGTWAFAVDLSGGTMAAPTGQGLLDVITLQGRGATVTVNP